MRACVCVCLSLHYTQPDSKSILGRIAMQYAVRLFRLLQSRPASTFIPLSILYIFIIIGLTGGGKTTDKQCDTRTRLFIPHMIIGCNGNLSGPIQKISE